MIFSAIKRSFCLPPAVPSAPQNLTATNVLATQFTLQWQPPFVPNGIIQVYAVLYQATFTLNQVPANFFQVQQIGVAGLIHTISATPYTEYVVNVLAATSAGFGDFASITVLTAEARELACIMSPEVLWYITYMQPTSNHAAICTSNIDYCIYPYDTSNLSSKLLRRVRSLCCALNQLIIV